MIDHKQNNETSLSFAFDLIVIINNPLYVTVIYMDTIRPILIKVQL